MKKQKRGRERQRSLVEPRLANELLKDNPHMSEKRMRGRQKRRIKSAGVATTTWGGGGKLIP